MRFLGNLIWFLLAGVWLFLAYLLAAILCFILIITIPFGVAALRIGVFALWPFGRAIVRPPTSGVGSTLGNVIWILIGGWYLALMHLVTGILLCVTIIGIPLGLGNFKLIPVSLTPFGRHIVSVEEARAAGLSTSASF
ncbi:MAG: YccF domain-containing protein [Solirubrobacteraceae bacterium]